MSKELEKNVWYEVKEIENVNEGEQVYCYNIDQDCFYRGETMYYDPDTKKFYCGEAAYINNGYDDPTHFLIPPSIAKVPVRE